MGGGLDVKQICEVARCNANGLERWVQLLKDQILPGKEQNVTASTPIVSTQDVPVRRLRMVKGHLKPSTLPSTLAQPF